MATQVESQILGQCGNYASDGAVLAGSLQLLEGSVSTINVVLVVLGVVQLHDLAGDVGLQSVVCVIQLGKFVLSHSF